MQPGDVIAHGGDRPAWHGARRNEHREIGLAAGGGEGRCDVVRLALRAREAHDEHVLGEPAFVTRLVARDAQRMALLAEQCVAAVAAAEALDGELFREVHDETAVRVELTRGVQTLHETAFAADALERGAARAGHQHHVDDNVGTVSNFNAAARVRRVDRAHAVGHHVERAAFHAVLEELAHFRARLAWGHPVVVRAGIFRVRGAHEGQMLDARDVGGVRAGEEAVRVVRFVECLQFAGVLQLGEQRPVLFIGAFAPVHSVRLREFAHGGDPVGDLFGDSRQGRHRLCGCGHHGSRIWS